MQWFRMWTDAMDDEKLKLLAFEDRWHYVVILCMKRKGILDVADSEAMRDRKVGAKLGLGDRERDEVKRRLLEVSLIDEAWQPLGWTKRQFVSDADPTATQRKQKQRDRQRHAPVTRDRNPVTDESRTSHTAQSQIQKQITDTEKTKNPDRRTARAIVEPSEFADIRREYPKRSGGQRWGDALRFFKRRVTEGDEASTILAGVRRYAEFVRITGIERTAHVQQAATFLGDNRGYLEQWHAPPRAKSAVEQAREELRRPVNRHDDAVVSEQTGSPTGSSDLGSFARLLR